MVRVLNLRADFVQQLRRRSGGRIAGISSLDLVSALVDVLDVSAAGIVVDDSLAGLPLVFSEPVAELAEQVQSSVGHGPWLQCLALDRPVPADEDVLRSQWPAYHRALVTRTPYRSTAVLPLRTGRGAAFAVLHLFGTGPRLGLATELSAVQEELVDLLAVLVRLMPDEQLPAYLACRTHHRGRKRVWISVGMVAERFVLDDADALAMLRAYAFAHDLLLDDLADAMLSGALAPDGLLQDPDGQGDVEPATPRVTPVTARSRPRPGPVPDRAAPTSSTGAA